MEAHGPVRLTVKGKRGLALKPLVWGPSPPPFIDESLLGLVARTAARNGFRSMRRVLRLADIDCPHIPSLPLAKPEAVGNLATLLKVDAADVVSKLYLEREEPGRRHEIIDFHGCSIRARYRENKIRRASPRSLAVSPYHRATWDLRPFSFCVDSREILLSTCPVCSRSLGWTSTNGIPYCNLCLDDQGYPNVDLRDFSQPFVAVTDETALSFLCDVVHPDMARRDRARRNLAPEFSNVPSGELLDIVVSIACVLSGDEDVMGCGMRKFGSLEGFTRLTPDIMARASRTLLTWPDGFLDLADQMRSGARRRTRHAGILREMGGLSLLAWSPDFSEAIRSIFTQGNAAFVERLEFGTAGKAKLRLGLIPVGYITQKEAARRLKMRATDLKPLVGLPDVTILKMDKGMHTPILFRADEIAEIDRVRSDLIRQSTVAIQLGMPLWVVEELSSRGRLTVEEGPASVLTYGQVTVRTSSLEALLAAMQERILPHAPSRGKKATLLQAITQKARLDMPWVDLIEAILDGRLGLRSTGKARRGGFTANVSLVDASQLDALLEGATSNGARIGSARMTDQEASIILGTQSFTVCKLTQAGLLGSSGTSARRITGDDIAAFKATYAFTPEISRRLGTRTGLVRKILEERGIRPAFELDKGKRLIWRRADLP